MHFTSNNVLITMPWKREL